MLSKDIPALAVGGLTSDNIKAFVDTGAADFGMSGSLYKPGDSAETVGTKARYFIDDMRAIR